MAIVVSLFFVSCDSLISAAGGVKKVAATSLALSKATLDLPVGGTEQLAVAFLPANCTDSSGDWSSSDEAVVSVSDAGQIASLKEGSATITFTSTAGMKASCVVTAKVSVSSFSGYVLPVDALGHFTSKAEFYSTSYHAIFNTDGSFEEDWYDDYSTSSSASQDNGYKGTYTYVPSTYTLTRKILQLWNSTTKVWDSPLLGTISYTSASRKVFTEHQILSVYLPDLASSPSSWHIATVYDYTNQLYPANNRTTTYDYKYTIGANGIFTYNETDTMVTPAYPAGYTDYTETISGTYTSLPASELLIPGNVVSYRVLPTLAEYRNANSTNPSTLDPAVQEDLSYSMYTFMNTGTYIIVPSSIQSRSIR